MIYSIKSQQGIEFIITNGSLLDDYKQKVHLPTDILSMSSDRYLQCCTLK